MSLTEKINEDWGDLKVSKNAYRSVEIHCSYTIENSGLGGGDT